MIKRIRHSLYRNRKALSLLTGSQVLNLGIGFACSVLWTRMFTQEMYGSYQFILSVIGIISSFCLSGLSQSASISSAKGWDGNFRALIRLKLVMALLGTAAMLAYAVYLRRDGRPEVAFALAVSSPLLFGLLLPDIVIPWINSKRDFPFLAFAQTLPTIASFLVLSVAAVLKVQSLLLMVLAIQGLIALSNLAVSWRTDRLYRKNDVKERQLIRFGYHASAAGLLGWIMFADRFLIHEKLSASDLAIYTVAMIFPGQIKTLYSLAGQFITPDMNEALDVTDAWKKLKFKLSSLIVIFFIVGVAGFFAVQILVPAFFSEKYARAASLGKWVLLAFSIAAPMTYFGNILRAQQKKVFIYGYEIIQPLFSIALYAALIGRGLDGMILAQILRQGFACLFFGGAFAFYLRKEKRRT